MLNGQAEGIASNPVIGAIQAIVAHPSNADVVWIGSANGGIWKTTNATNASPAWTSAGDALSSTSIGALALDPTDGTSSTLVAGFGRFSSFSRVGGPRNGIVRTTNGGTSWAATGSTNLAGKNISGIAPRGATIVVSVEGADSFTCANIGVFRSTDTGDTFSAISGSGGSGLPSGRAFDLASDPTNNAVLYTAIRDASFCSGGANGVYRSTNTGSTWTKVSDSTMDTLLAESEVLPGNPSNARIAVGASGQVYVGIIDGNGQLSGLFRSATGTGSWTQLDTPSTNEGGNGYGIQPEREAGGQGAIHFSIVADPTNASIVYVGGDRQPGVGDTGASFPNSIGATNYTGRLFRVNAAAGAGTQVTPLTHCSTATAACNSTTSTSSNSAPHADSRRMVFDAGGNILEGDDGGIFRRTNPRTTGDWFSVNGNLGVNEMHDVAYDTVSNMVFSGNQDNGSAEQTTVGGTTWNQISSGDGGDVAVDDASSGSQSVRFSSFQSLGNFRRRVMNVAGSTTSTVFPALTVTGGGPDLEGQFVTPVEVNVVDGSRLLIAADNDLYESLDRGDTVTALGLGRRVTAIVYGGKAGGVDNVNLIYAIAITGLNTNGPNVFRRSGGSGPPVQTTTSPGTATLRDIAVNPADWNNAFVVNSVGEVWTTTNAGGLWTNITGNLPDGSGDLRTILFVSGSPNALIVGGLNGVFRMPVDEVGVWKQFGFGMSPALVFDLDYDATDDMLVAGTMGRGAWTLTPVQNLGPFPTLSINDVEVTEGNAGTTNAVFTVSLSQTSVSPVSVAYTTSNDTAAAGVGTFSNSASITIPTSGSASPYPATVSVSGLTGTITELTATLTGLSHTYTSDVDILLVGPEGQSVVLVSDAGGQFFASSNLTLTFDDDALSFLPGTPFSSGTYKPTNIADGEGGDSYVAPAPGSGYGSAMSVFNETAPNGTWSLYVRDDAGPDGGSLSGGFSITITTTGGDYVSSSGTVELDPGELTQPVTIPINGDVIDESNEMFFVTLSSPANATILDAQGVGTILDDDGVVLSPPTNVVATATSTTSVSITWTASAGAASYRVYRSSGTGFSLVGSPAGTSLSDATASANTAYLYKVRAFAGSESGDSNVDVATTVVFTDPTLNSSIAVKLAHFNELLTAVNAIRALAALSPIVFTAPTPATSVTVRRQHLLDLRTGIDAARTALLFSALSYTDPTITAGATVIKSLHLTEIRNGLK